MRKPGSSIPAKDRTVGGRDVTADKIISLLAECAAGVLLPGVPGLPGRARRSLAPVSPVPKRIWVDGRGGLEGCGDRDKGGARAGSPRASRRSPPLRGRPVGSRDGIPRPGIPPGRGESPSRVLGV